MVSPLVEVSLGIAALTFAYSWLFYFARKKVKQASYSVSDTKSIESLKKLTEKNSLVELVRGDQ